MSTYWWLTHAQLQTLNYPEAFCFSTFYPATIEISQLEILVHPGSFLLLPWSWGFSMSGKRFPSGKYHTCQPHICSIGNLKAAAATNPFYKPKWRGFSQNRRSVNIFQQAHCDPSWAIPATQTHWALPGKVDPPGTLGCPAWGCRLPQLQIYLLLLFTAYAEWITTKKLRVWYLTAVKYKERPVEMSCTINVFVCAGLYLGDKWRHLKELLNLWKASQSK